MTTKNGFGQIKWNNHHQELQRILKNRFGDKEVVGIELGTFCGDSARAIIWALPNCKLYTVDPWIHVDGAEFEAGEQQPYHDKNKDLAYKKLSAPDMKDRVTILEMTSGEAAAHLKAQGISEVDFVWIDGDHSVEGIKNDIELFYPMVKDGGLIGGHDFGQIPPLTLVILRAFDKSLNSGNDYVWYVYKDLIK